MSGAFSVNREIFDHYLFDADEFSKRDAWLWMVSSAVYKPKKVKNPKGVVELQRGQFCYSIRYMAERFSWSKSRVQRFIDLLQSEGMIETDSGTGQMVVTVCNYSNYQQEIKPKDTDSGTAAGQQRDSSGTNKNKEINIYNPPIVPLNEGEDGADLIGDEKPEKKTRSQKSKRGTRVDDFELNEALIDWTVKTINENGWDFGGKGKFEFEKFKDYWQAQPDKNGVKKDWPATWRNWVRNGLQRGSLVGHQIQPTEQKQPRQKRIGA